MKAIFFALALLPLVAQAELPVYKSGLLTVNSLTLKDSVSPSGAPMKDLLADVTVITGCQPTEEIVIAPQVRAFDAQSPAKYLVSGAAKVEPAFINHCFAIGYAHETVKIDSYPVGAIPVAITVNSKKM